MRILILFAVLFGLSVLEKEIFAQKLIFDSKSDKKQIILLRPTVNNIKTYQYLTQNKIFPLAADYKVVGVYHALEKFDYTKADEYIKNEGITNIKLIKIEPVLSPENIYKENACSDLFRNLFNNSNGAIFFGGDDIPPACFGEPTNLLTVIFDLHRHYLELSFLYHLLGGYQDNTYVPLLKQKPNFTILGICLGMQTMNVATGGSLYQDIPTEIYDIKTVEGVLVQEQNKRHRNYQTNFSTDDEVTADNYHQIVFNNDFLFKTLNLNDTIKPYVLSSHHQCVKKAGKDFKMIAFDVDGKIPEMMVHSVFPNVIGVQFHPEVADLYKPEKKIKAIPLQVAKYSYLDLYSGNKGEVFLRSFWKFIAEKFK